ncbi:MAG: hypothetical protein RSC92_05420 [Clostridia bacterium]
MISDLTFIKKDLGRNDFLGIVIYNKDPLYSGRCKVRVFGIMDNIKDEFIPWATPINSNIYSGSGAGSLSVPKIGTYVRINFNNSNIYSPEYTAIQNIDKSLIEKIKDDYENTHVLMYDNIENVNIIYQKESGLSIFHKDSYININKDAMITIHHANDDSVIQLDGKKINIVAKNEINISASGMVNLNADEVNAEGNNTTKIGSGTFQPACLSTAVWTALETLASAIDTKLPSTPGVTTAQIKTLSGIGKSKNVLISE